MSRVQEEDRLRIDRHARLFASGLPPQWRNSKLSPHSDMANDPRHRLLRNSWGMVGRLSYCGICNEQSAKLVVLYSSRVDVKVVVIRQIFIL